MGWLDYTWRIPGETVALGDPAVCPATNTPDEDPWFNDCATPIPNRTFQRVFGTPSSQCSTGEEWGCKAGDAERFWASAARTQYVDWAWKQQDYPHPSETQYNPAQAPERVSVRMWLTPKDVEEDGILINGMYTAVQDFEQSEEIIFNRPRYALPPHRWIMPLQIDPWRFFAVGEKAASLLLAPQPPETALDETYLFGTTTAYDAQVGLLATPLDVSTYAFVPAISSQRTNTSVWPTVGAAVSQDGPFVFAVGGLDATGARSSGVWVGVVEEGKLQLLTIDQMQPALLEWRLGKGFASTGATFYQMAQGLTQSGAVALANPLGRDGAILVTDLKAGRLALLFGTNASDQPEPPAFYDIEANTWMVITQPTEASWLKRRDVGAQPTSNGRWLYIFGGKNANGSYRAGLYKMALDPTSLVDQHINPPSAIDTGSPSAPSARTHAALALDERRGMLYLFGGISASGPVADLWKFSLATGKWLRLSDGTSAKAPPPMAAAGMRLSRLDGSLVLFPGTRPSEVYELRAHRSFRFNGMRWARATRANPERASGTITQGQERYMSFLVGPQARSIRVAMTGTNDADLYTRFGSPPTTSSFDCRPYYGSSNETCTHAQNVGGYQALYVMVRGWSPQSDYALDVSWESTPIQSATSITQGQEWRLAIPVASSAKNISVSITGTNDADLYTRFGSAPTTSDFDCRPYYGNSDETCNHASASSEWLHIMVHGYASLSDVNLNVTWD
ncbi:MAG: pre-peptidase C-terminal domain-containing protein [Deltaproteobacteria bacterium]|nr:pre-peptidase C-terminal domain-containing protein [Deltaproteobacteria bacterium]